MTISGQIINEWMQLVNHCNTEFLKAMKMPQHLSKISSFNKFDLSKEEIFYCQDGALKVKIVFTHRCPDQLLCYATLRPIALVVYVCWLSLSIKRPHSGMISECTKYTLYNTPYLCTVEHPLEFWGCPFNRVRNVLLM